MATTKKKIEHIPGTTVHQVYRLKNGQRVPGGSFIAKVAGSWQSAPFLTKWANGLGLEGIDSEKYKDKLADVGTVNHGMIENYFLGEDNQELFDRFPKWVVDQAKICFAKFEQWASHYDFDPVIFEGYVKRDGLWVPYRDDGMVSEIYKFGGTVDYFGGIKHKAGIVCDREKCPLRGKPNTWFNILLDWKSTKNLYNSHLYQVAGYNTLLFENGFESQLVGILKIGRNEKEGFKFVYRTSKEILLQWEIFRYALQMLTLQNTEPKWLN
jgi:hypothetical protein